MLGNPLLKASKDHSHKSITAKPSPPGDKPSTPPPPPPPDWSRWLLPMGILVAVWFLLGNLVSGTGTHTLTYTQFIKEVSAQKVQSVSITPDGEVEGKLKGGEAFTSAIPTAVPDQGLAARLERNNVQVVAVAQPASILGFLASVAPLLLIVGIFVYMGRRAKGQLGGISSIARSRTKVVDTERPTTRFEDVAGYDGVKLEITEVVDFLKRPDKYTRAGAVAPRGVLMVGPPGTGKTLLARAVAGEASVPFLSVTGSTFVEMFVGVGAARTRDLFAEARKRAPAIIFIDEIDAIGHRRGGGMAVTNDEREQTLNQLLAEMDGFDPAVGVVVMAATNRPEVLDPALLRPGRFDRQVVVPLPTQTDRRAILEVHCRGKKLSGDADLGIVARGTPGFSGADLANLVNEAAIAAARAGRQTLSASDFDEARDRMLLGRREGSNVLLPDEKHAVAVHESGHALMAALSRHADPVAKVTILPAGMALGVTEQLPVDERHLYSESYMNDSLVVRLGGRAAELVVFHEGSSGASNDLAGATDLAMRMIREFGLSPVLGPVGYASSSPMYLGAEEIQTRAYAEETQRLIDQEVSRLVSEAERRATELLRKHRTELDALTHLLLEHETVDGSQVYELLGKGVPGGERSPIRSALRSSNGLPVGSTGQAGAMRHPLVAATTTPQDE
jgi:cell division protease FtsH